MKTYLILLFIFFFIITSLHPNKNNTKGVKEQKNVIAKDYRNKIDEKGINFIKLGNSISNIKAKLDAIYKLPKINTPEYNYYTLDNKIKDKNFQNESIIIKDKQIYYKNLIELKIVEETKERLNTKTYSPKELKYPTSKIYKELKSVSLSFYKKHLYKATFYLMVNPQTMNKIVEDMHKILGEDSNYSEILETYKWQRYNDNSNYTITISLLGRLFPREIKISFIDKTKENLLQNDFKKEKQIIDNLLSY